MGEIASVHRVAGWHWPAWVADVLLLPVALLWGVIDNYLPVISPMSRAYEDGQPLDRLVIVLNPESTSTALRHAGGLLLLIVAAGWPLVRRPAWGQVVGGAGVMLAGWCGVALSSGFFFFSHHWSCVHTDCSPYGSQRVLMWTPLAFTGLVMVLVGLLGRRLSPWVRLLVPVVGFVVSVLALRLLWTHVLLDRLATV